MKRMGQRNRRRQQKTIWILWGLTIWLILLLILFGSDNIIRDGRLGKNSNSNTTISNNIADGEHIPGNIPSGSKEDPPAIIPDETEGAIVAVKPEEEEPEEGFTVPEPGEEEPEESLTVPEPGEEESEDNPAVPEPETENPKEDSAISEPEKEQETLIAVPERSIDPEKPMVALTFDDGPYRNNTKAILDLFEQYNGRATFFVVGYHLDVFAEDTVEAYRRGFQIGNHTMNHPSLPTLKDEEALEEIQSLNRKLNALGIPGEVMVRPPYGQHTEYLRKNLTVPMIGWNVDSQDWISQDADKIYEQIVGKVKDGDIVLLHDLHNVTAEAMQRVVPALTEQGFQLVTVEEMFAAKEIEPQAGFYYGSIR